MRIASRLLLVLVAGSLLAIGVAASRILELSDPDVPVLVALSGAHSRIAEPQYLRINSADEFQSLYMRHLGHEPADFNALHNRHGVPEIDFDHCMVIAIFRGEGWNSAGVFIDSVIRQEDRLVVRFDERTYQTAGPGGGGRRVTPYGIFILPRTDSEVVLEQNTQGLKADPPDWKPAVRFPALR